jgi:hypothetical protein
MSSQTGGIEYTLHVSGNGHAIYDFKNAPVPPEGALLSVSEEGPFYVCATVVLEANVRFRAVGGYADEASPSRYSVVASHLPGARGFLKGEGGLWYDLGRGEEGGASERVAGPGAYAVMASPPDGHVCVWVSGGGVLEVEGGGEREVFAVMAEAAVSVTLVSEEAWEGAHRQGALDEGAHRQGALDEGAHRQGPQDRESGLGLCGHQGRTRGGLCDDDGLIQIVQEVMGGIVEAAAAGKGGREEGGRVGAGIPDSGGFETRDNSLSAPGRRPTADSDVPVTRNGARDEIVPEIYLYFKGVAAQVRGDAAGGEEREESKQSPSAFVGGRISGRLSDMALDIAPEICVPLTAGEGSGRLGGAGRYLLRFKVPAGNKDEGGESGAGGGDDSHQWVVTGASVAGVIVDEWDAESPILSLPASSWRGTRGGPVPVKLRVRRGGA